MAIFEWRKFNFFDLQGNVDDGKVAKALKDATITSSTNGNNQIILCDSLGLIHLFNRNWDVISFKGHDGCISLCELATQHNLLITVGDDENGSVPVFKVWNLSKTTRSTVSCLRTVRTALQKPTALGVSENGQFLAIGFDRGSISLYRGDISRDRSKNMKTLSGGISAITGIQFKQCGKVVQMFVCSDSGVLVYNLEHKDKEPKIVLDKTCEPTRCCALQKSSIGLSETHFMVGRDDAVYCYTVDGRGPCYALEGQKSIIQWFRSHLLTISKPNKGTMSTQKDSVLTIIDISNKFIVFTAPISATAAILVEFGTCYIITTNKEVFHLDEKDLNSKLDLLFQKNLYDIAVRIAKSNQYDSEGLAQIFKQYGDHLYKKGDFSGAVEQYIKTIGYLEPSYIIRRFLDSKHINFLTDYLQALHKQGHATSDHTTLLLNCFTRLDRTDQLKEFLSNDSNPDIVFDLDVAIKVCRTASAEHALSLAKRNRKHDLAISILIEDQQAFFEALTYISHLKFNDAEASLKKYGLILMQKCQGETTELLKKLCTNYRESNALGETNLLDINAPVDRANCEDFIHFFVNSPTHLIDFLEHLVRNLTDCSQLVYNTLIEHYLCEWKLNPTSEERLMEIMKNHVDSYDRNHVLILCSTYDFWPGIMLIYEEQKLYHLIVRHYLKNRDYNSLLNICKRLGANQPQLWLQALTGLRKDKTAPSNLLPQILQVIAQEKLQSPLQVLNCLAVESGPNLSSVREYFLQVFQKEYDSTKQEEEAVEKYRKDSVVLKNHIKNLQETTIEFRGTICDTCHQPLSMPALYFLCQHSYHQDCVRGYSENDKDCPVCHSKNVQLVDALHAQSESRGQHELFHNLLDRSTEPFSVVAEYFGRGLFNKIVLVEEDNNEINQNVVSQRIKDQSQVNPFNNYGAGAEAKIRMDEGSTTKNRLDPARKIPVPEARMRFQEANRFSTSLEANITRPPVVRDKSPRVTPFGSPKKQSNSISKNIVNQRAKNPFEDGDGYDDSKNPFAEDEKDGADAEQGNPFGEYDDNLNPFA
ncbi:Vacuolar protein sorting-associated protein 11 like [Pseudolycoriella hygida]|uniref:Vacuolar protein sorting-associated protein 11 homolog n=1 Tax=Pseudolycoriella hygida TaxID=35572 RepID=A0A9Q0S5M2_9DIPT|nr:Vacuolar protein sorting-associated protein 11 like [Pseudolycoriella hygida]